MKATETAVLEVDLAAIVANWRLLRSLHPTGPVAALVKANAYGLGAASVAPALLTAGCRHFFVAHVQEALALRDLLPGAMLAVLHGVPPGAEAECAARGIDPVLGSLEAIGRWAALAWRLGRTLPALLQVDTGMNRLGLDEAAQAVLRAEPCRLEGIVLRYVMTHLISSELPNDSDNAIQQRRFAAACRGFPGVECSFANSSGIFLGEGFGSDLARPGAALYGINPTPGRDNPMRGTVRLRAPVLQVREIRPGESVGYNATWQAERQSRIATLAIGYADGWKRALSGSLSAYFDGAPAPLVGRVSMDLTTCDVTDHPRIGPGDWLELIGPAQPVDAVAEAAGTNGYEILTSLGPRIARVYRA